MNIIAIDLGFMYTKVRTRNSQIIMKSVVGDSKPQNFRDLDMGFNNSKDNIRCLLDGTEYFVSDLALDQSDSVFYSLREDRFNSDTIDVLVKTSFALGLGEGQHEAYVVSGLPTSHYSRYKQDIKNLFLPEDNSGTHGYVVLNGGKSVIGDVKVVDGKFTPQPFGALIDKVLDDQGQIADPRLSTKTVAVIDPGFGTTDVYVTDSLSPVEKLSFSTKIAMNHAYTLIANKIEETFDVTLPLYKVERIARRGLFKKDGREYNIANIRNWAYKSTSQQIVSEVMNKWKSTHEIDRVILAGGGGEALRQWILPEFPSIECADNSQWSVVNGYYKWGVRNYGR